MCQERPCFTSVLGLSLGRASLLAGVAGLILTSATTALNLVKFTQFTQLYGPECDTRDVCIGPLIKVEFIIILSLVLALLPSNENLTLA